MNPTCTARPASLFSFTLARLAALSTWLREHALRLGAWLIVLKVVSVEAAFAAGTPTDLINATDANASTFCTYVNVLPTSKWVKAGALVLFVIGACIMIFGGRGGNVYLMRGLGAVIIIPSIIAIAKAFGMVC